MAQVIPFEERAVAALRDRLGAAETARADLIAFAQGHSGAVAAIHSAALAAMDADDVGQLIAIVTRDWPAILGVDHVAVALEVEGRVFLSGPNGTSRLDQALFDRMCAGLGDVTLRGVDRGHALFGPFAGEIRAEALVKLDPPLPLPRGMLAIGQRQPLALNGNHGEGLLRFLGGVVESMIRSCMVRGTIAD